jgi:hypothetical protein
LSGEVPNVAVKWVTPVLCFGKVLCSDFSLESDPTEVPLSFLSQFLQANAIVVHVIKP